MDWFLDLLKVAAPIVGAAIGLIGNWQAQAAASEAERKYLESASAARDIARQALEAARRGAGVNNLVQGTLRSVSGQLAGGGIYDSSIASNVMSAAASDVLARLAPQQMQLVQDAYRMMTIPEQWLFNAYLSAAQNAAGQGGFSMGSLIDLLPLVFNWGGAKQAGGYIPTSGLGGQVRLTM